MFRISTVASFAAGLFIATAAIAENSQNTAELAKQLQNPIANLISVPLQFNYNQYPGGTGNQYYVNIEPVIPFSISKDWNVISRTILPVYKQNISDTEGRQIGFGSTTASFFFSPKAPGSGGMTWGVGPAILIPTATDNLGTNQWGAGPTAVVLKQSHGWTYGGLASQIWSFTGNDGNGEISQFFVQPFLAYTTKKATTFGMNTESTYDWVADEWSVPINMFVAQLVRFGKQHVQFELGARYWADAPEYGPEGWGARFDTIFLFPK